MLPSSLPTRILIVEDDEDDFLIIEACIKDIPEKDFRIDWCYDYDDALQRIGEGLYDLYFVDYLLGAKTGLDLLKEAIVMGTEEPLVLLTGIGNRDLDVQAMNIGAVDYLVKSEINTEKLERCIRYALERSAYIRALRVNELKFRNIFERSKDAVFLPATTSFSGMSMQPPASSSIYQGRADADGTLRSFRAQGGGGPVAGPRCR